MLQRTRERSPRQTRRALLLLLGVGATLSAARTAVSESNEDRSFKIIVHPETKLAELSREFLANAFLRNVRDWENGQRILPVDQLPSSSPRQEFSERILLRSVSAVRSYWQQRIFSGRGVPPPELESDAAVIRYVLGNRGAVGYISRAAEPGAARVIVVH